MMDIMDNLEDNQRLPLSSNNLEDSDVKSLAQALKGTQIARLDLSNNNIGCNGLKYLTEVLKDTQITELNLSNNDIMDEGAKLLAESLQGTKITELDLSGNKIGCDAAPYFNEMLSNIKMRSLHLDIYYAEDITDANKYISQRSYGGIKNIHISLNDNKIGIRCAQYLNETFQNLTIARLELDRHYLEADDAQYLAQAFKGTTINELVMHYKHILQPDGIQYLVQAFKDSRIATLNVYSQEIGTKGTQYLAEFLREVKVLGLNLSLNYIRDEGMKYLVPVLKNSDIMYFNVARNDIRAEGARYLSEILLSSKIIFINLCNNSIGTDGVGYLADSLPHSQVTSIHLYGNGFGYAGYQYLIDVVDNTNITWVNLRGNNIKDRLKRRVKISPYSIPRNTTSIACEIRHAFKELVALNPISNEFEFIVPRKDNSSADIDQYAFLIGTLKFNPNLKVHIFDMMCKKDNGDVYDFNTMDSINKFIAIMQDKFNTFIDSKLPDLVELFGSYNYVNLVKQFEDMKLYDVVENLLLHRVLYYVDENQEILHPYIYKMLDKHGMPLYNKQLEPNKKEEIISYYQSYQEIDDSAEEIINLLQSESFR